MRSPRPRHVALLLLALWLIPSVASFGASLHVVLEHSHANVSHSHAMLPIAESATHGHGHHHEPPPSQAGSHHDHAPLVETDSASLCALASMPTVLTNLGLAIESAEDDPSSDRSHDPSPALFTVHCALLL